MTIIVTQGTVDPNITAKVVVYHGTFRATNFGLPIIAPTVGAEVIYSFAIIFCSLMIYFGTRELYELSTYKGLKYFRCAFLFLAIAYIFRLPTISLAPGPEITSLIWVYISLFAFMYFSSMAIFYLIEGVLWKNLKESSKISYLFHGIAIIISLATIIFNNPFFYLGLNVILFISAGIAIYLASHNHKLKSKKNYFHRLYILLLVFLVLNIFSALVPIFMDTLKLFLYLVSLSVFFVILYRVLKKSGD
jgi:hypothetical protein